MKTNLPRDWAWTPQHAFLLVCLILKASCLSGSGSGSVSGAEGRPVCSKHRDLRGLFEAGQTVLVTGSPETQSKQCAVSKDPGPGQTRRLAVTTAVMRECLPTSKQRRDIWQPELLTAPDKQSRKRARWKWRRKHQENNWQGETRDEIQAEVRPSEEEADRQCVWRGENHGGKKEEDEVQKQNNEWQAFFSTPSNLL